MSWDLIKSIQKNGADLRLIMPFGLALNPGDVISVGGKDGSFRLEGTCKSILGRGPGKLRPAKADNDSYSLFRQSGNDVKMKYRAQGAASTLFEGLPTGKAGFDISFESAKSWLLAFTGRTVTVLEEANAFRRPILDAYRWKTWQPDWALVTGIGRVESMTLLASKSSNTDLAIALNGDASANVTHEVQFAGGASILAQSQEVIQCMPDGPATAFCQAVRVRDPWWKIWGHPDIGALESVRGTQDPDAAAERDFWEDVDQLG